MPPVDECVAMALAKVSAHLPIQRIVVEQLVQFLEDGINALGHLRHPRKHVFSLIVIHKHPAFLLHVVLARFLLSFEHVACSHTASQAHFAPDTSTREYKAKTWVETSSKRLILQSNYCGSLASSQL